MAEEIAVPPLWRGVRDIWGMGRPSPEDKPKAPALGVLYQVVRDHFETFCAEAAGAHERGGLPRFIEEESVSCAVVACPSPSATV